MRTRVVFIGMLLPDKHEHLQQQTDRLYTGFEILVTSISPISTALIRQSARAARPACLPTETSSCSKRIVGLIGLNMSGRDSGVWLQSGDFCMIHFM